MAGALVLPEDFNGGLKLFTGLKARPPMVIDRVVLQAIMGATSSNIMPAGTGRSYKSYVGAYLAFAVAMGAPHAEGCPPGVPVTFSVLMAYCVWYVALKPNRLHPGEPHAAKSLNAAFAALKAAARMDEWARTDANREAYNGNPGFAISEAERRTLTGVLAALTKTYPTGDSGRKLPFRMAFLELMWERGARTPTWESQRDRVWQGVAHQGLLRSSEVCALRAQDILQVRDGLGRIVAVQVRIVTSKTAERFDVATGGAQFVTLARRPDNCDIVIPLIEWMEAREMLAPSGQMAAPGREKDYLFPARQGGMTPITKVMISEILRAGLVAIGMAEDMISSYSGRSLRAGGATDMRDSGVAWHVIGMQGRWCSEAWKVY
jgi:hypothetical protein